MTTDDVSRMMPNSVDPLASMLRRAQDGDLPSFEAFYAATIRQVMPGVRRICGEAHFEDALADAYFQAWRTVGSFDPERAGALTWIKMIACSRARDLIRVERVRHAGATGAPDHDADQQQDPEPGPEQRLQSAQIRTRVHAAVDALPSTQRMVVSMAYYGDSSQAEIASMTGLAPGKVKHLMNDAQHRLKSALTASNRATQP